MSLSLGIPELPAQEMPIQRFVGIPPNRHATGEIESMDLLAGQGVGLVTEIQSAPEIVRTIADEARAIITKRLGAPD